MDTCRHTLVQQQEVVVVLVYRHHYESPFPSRAKKKSNKENIPSVSILNAKIKVW
jgi:hypothetical protein